MSWWLSFADDTGWRGGCFVTGEDMLSAIQHANRRGLNPGGEIVGAELKSGTPVEPRHAFRLVRTMAEAEEVFGKMTKAPKNILKGMVCEECNEPGN